MEDIEDDEFETLTLSGSTSATSSMSNANKEKTSAFDDIARSSSELVSPSLIEDLVETIPPETTNDDVNTSQQSEQRSGKVHHEREPNEEKVYTVPMFDDLALESFPDEYSSDEANRSVVRRENPSTNIAVSSTRDDFSAPSPAFGLEQSVLSRSPSSHEVLSASTKLDQVEELVETAASSPNSRSDENQMRSTPEGQERAPDESSKGKEQERSGVDAKSANAVVMNDLTVETFPEDMEGEEVESRSTATASSTATPANHHGASASVGAHQGGEGDEDDRSSISEDASTASSHTDSALGSKPTVSEFDSTFRSSGTVSLTAAAVAAAPTTPSKLPSGWKVMWSKAYRLPYFHNTATRESSWTSPSQSPAIETPTVERRRAIPDRLRKTLYKDVPQAW